MNNDNTDDRPCCQAPRLFPSHLGWTSFAIASTRPLVQPTNAMLVPVGRTSFFHPVLQSGLREAGCIKERVRKQSVAADIVLRASGTTAPNPTLRGLGCSHLEERRCGVMHSPSVVGPGRSRPQTAGTPYCGRQSSCTLPGSAMMEQGTDSRTVSRRASCSWRGRLEAAILAGQDRMRARRIRVCWAVMSEHMVRYPPLPNRVPCCALNGPSRAAYGAAHGDRTVLWSNISHRRLSNRPFVPSRAASMFISASLKITSPWNSRRWMVCFDLHPVSTVVSCGSFPLVVLNYMSLPPLCSHTNSLKPYYHRN